jgi:hypothetical protein
MDEFTEAPAPEAPAPERKPVEQWAAEKGTVAWKFAAAQAGERWPIGAELTEAEYTDAIERAANVRLG